ncbi:MAG: chemotaxis protein CheB [Candidatus Rokubacteria bacterium]|nr:chemotaxis protein CheB [Candidatus Rokubacteria bacterium]
MPRTINAEARPRDVVTIGASAGGVQALMQLLAKLPADLPAIVGIVLHRSPYHETRLPAVLGRHASINVVEPEDGQPLVPSTVYVAPRDRHLTFSTGHAHLDHGPKEHRTRPAADPLFRSAADTFGARVVGVLLSGYGSDGVPGLIRIKAAGGISLVQDPREALHPVMPTRAIVEDDVDAILPLDGLATAIVALAHGRSLHHGTEVVEAPEARFGRY